MLHGTKGNAKVGARPKKFCRAVVVLDESHSDESQKHCRDFIPHNRDERINHLHTAKESRVFEYTSDGGFVTKMAFFCWILRPLVTLLGSGNRHN